MKVNCRDAILMLIKMKKSYLYREKSWLRSKIHKKATIKKKEKNLPFCKRNTNTQQNKTTIVTGLNLIIISPSLHTKPLYLAIQQ
jgi:ubiquitin